MESESQLTAGSRSPASAGSETPLRVDPNDPVGYPMWRFFAWADNQGSYIEIDDKVERGELVPELPYKSPN